MGVAPFMETPIYQGKMIQDRPSNCSCCWLVTSAAGPRLNWGRANIPIDCDINWFGISMAYICVHPLMSVIVLFESEVQSLLVQQRNKILPHSELNCMGQWLFAVFFPKKEERRV